MNFILLSDSQPTHVLCIKTFQDLKLDRYKILVQVVIGEQKGEGVKVACRCLWDSDTDNYAQDIFMTDTFFVLRQFMVFIIINRDIHSSQIKNAVPFQDIFAQISIIN
ncbi:dynein light chain Tctex-type protein 2B-like [Xenia sp. Carnegie-2017]|uniref:dynein light chain Tctex-type protein 2B-like n=1 Tax=Xenia sp. Carnegie-2017 TaxID=2897299 RepID=UPI001F04625D|nr:dynein light chain Tctex-type protein 2B-like [Xenia sp. Carnegie-2017]